jgi:TPR repeat protein
MYKKGQGVPKDPHKALYWFERSAAQGDPQSQYNLGAMFAEGDGVPKDWAKAEFWLGKAADQGDRKARIVLSVMSRDYPVN